MMFDFRKCLKIALVAAVFCQISNHADAHWCAGTLNHNHGAVNCDPTVSPAPTESPAPSPSPSAVPTDTQMPSRSLEPSSSPTNSPTTSQPSSNPTDDPTESPAPSPSPSMVPSAQPTTSAAPSKNPTDSPSESPSQSPTVSPSAYPTTSPSDSPTSPLLLTVLDVGFTFANVTDDLLMGPRGIEIFERDSTLYLQNHVREAPGVFMIRVENVVVQKQEFVTFEVVEPEVVVPEVVTNQTGNNTIGNDPFFRRQRRLESQTDLIITVDVVVSVNLNRSEDLELNDFFEEFFDTPDHQNELRTMVKLEEKQFAPELYAKGDNASLKNVPVKKSSYRGAVAGAVLGILALIVGSGLIWMWVQTRKEPSNNGKLENVGTISKSFESEDRRESVTKSLFKREIEYADSNEQSDSSSVNQNGRSRRKSSLTPLMYVPALMPTESNIEVPDTPGTNFAVNGFATPASASGFATPVNASGFMTPSSTRSRGNATLPKLLGETSPDDEISRVETPKSMKRIPLPPKSFGHLKSPFSRRDSDVSGLGVVAGKNNIRPFENRRMNETEAEMILRDLPMEIGGPSTATKQEEIVFRPATGPKPTVILVEDDLMSRKTTSSRRKKKQPPRPWPPQTSSSNNTVASSKSRRKKDHSVVDIVDEIAYLYSTNDPERYTNSSSDA